MLACVFVLAACSTPATEDTKTPDEKTSTETTLEVETPETSKTTTDDIDATGTDDKAELDAAIKDLKETEDKLEKTVEGLEIDESGVEGIAL